MPEENEVENEDGLTYTKRYTVGVLKPEESSEGSKCFGLFFETNKLVEAKKQADQAFKEDGLETVVWDKEKWSSSSGQAVYCLSPEEQVKDDDGSTKKKKPTKRKPARKKARTR
tara:strand:- start:888 stop:1229 length:342 start_codon:yes stop_codon:yes gene_type:complete